MIVRYKKMWYECQWDNSQSKSQTAKVNRFKSKYDRFGFHRTANYNGPKN